MLPPESVRRQTLPNGLTLLVRRDGTAPVVAIVTYVKAGYFDESDDVVGISHVLEHMYFKGTERRGVGEISRQTKAAGGYLNAGTIYDHTGYYTVLPSSGFLQGLEIQADAYANSLVDAGELAKELEVIIQEAKRKADNPAAVTIETLYELLHDRHRIRRWRIGREPGLRALTRDAVLRFYRTFYQPSNTTLTIVGDVDPDQVGRHVERLYGAFPNRPFQRDRGPAEDGAPRFRYRELHGDITQTQLAFGWRTPGTTHEDTPTLELAAGVLGTGRASRLYRAVRERKLCASISAYNYTPVELGVFTVHAEGPPETAPDAANATWDQVRDLRERGADPEELARVQRIYEARWIRRLETMDGQANYLAEWEALGDWEFGHRYLERLLSATAERVTDVARRYLDADRCGIVAYRPASAPQFAPEAGAVLARLRSARPEPLPPLPELVAPNGTAPSRAPRLERVEARVRIYRTARGVPILVRHKGGAPLVHLGVHALGGASYEEEAYAGLTTLLVRTSIKGTERRSATQIAEEAELLGGAVATHSGAEHFGWSISVPTANFLRAAELLADVVQRPTVPDEVLDTERALAIADLALLRDDMYRYPLRLLTQAAFTGHPYGTPASGFESSLAAIGAQRVRDWHRARLLEAPVAVAVVGDVDADDAAAAAARYFAELRMGEPELLATPEWPSAPVSVAESRDKAQTALAIAFPSPARCDDDRFGALLIAGIASGLGGRFFEELRDRQSLAYTVHSFASQRRLAGTFISYIATSPEKEETARQGLLREFAKLREAPVTDQELIRAKAYTLGTYAIRQQSGGVVLGDLMDAWLLGRGLAELDDYEERVRGVTTRLLQDVARRYFDDSRLVESVVRGVGRTV